ncbi:MAG: hypothetical protein AAF431_09360 [Pseudomonadota bacterium]
MSKITHLGEARYLADCYYSVQQDGPREGVQQAVDRIVDPE